MLIDTDVLIWYMRGNERAFEIIENQNRFSISVVTYIELVQGMRSRQELKELRKALRYWNARIIYVYMLMKRFLQKQCFILNGTI